ncbi:Cysteine-rich RLK (receptor-like protein kinase) 8 [Cucumis melo var. makuwa]|uniref:Cysteine-rich RLK (Receptor-like protein kinase) 8 n=1 Tax=Cucumis melo var. makuwa TaxID=1194695 RepID=A0A5D3DMB6_CUCMM|nr:Cysteine-rich RLK (receptor-like protein kinase) 8 [Cucumis melo var. makuwa]TYK24783.1 Cysteine-rich RLK (receptor-like protein kinase) 8 [Cucumis melo var. makuwa]
MGDHSQIRGQMVQLIDIRPSYLQKRSLRPTELTILRLSPVAKLNTLRVLLYNVVNKDWPLYQLEVKNAFLNENLKEDVYMCLPPGFEAQFNNQSQRYNEEHYDHTLFTKLTKTGNFKILENNIGQRVDV